MPAGELRERVRFDRRMTVADDGYGNTLGQWEEFAGPCAARIAPTAGSEETLADGQAALGNVEITIRSCAMARQINPGDRAVNVRTGRTFNIASVINDDEHNQFLT